MTPLAWAALVVVYIVWGSTYLAIGIGIETIPPMLSGSMRFLLAALLLASFLAIRHGPGVLRVSPRRLGSAVLVGVLLLTGGNGMVAVAEQHISTGLAALLVASMPLWLVIFGTGVGDRPPRATLVGVITGFAGVALLSVLPGDGGASGSVLGVAVILFATFSWALGSFLAGRLPMPANSFTTSVYEMAAGGLALLAVGFGRGETLDVGQISGRSWFALAYLVVFGSLLAFTSYAWLLGNAPMSIVGTYAYVNPVVAVLLGALILNEKVTWETLLGGLIIVFGVGIVVTTESRRRHAVPEPVPEPVPKEDDARPAEDVALESP
ncbi:drug/metabolite transporter (DMT)-like permease [Thermomonospora umbrina]|uniref:Drug/metabolite transporter (DMT)-like permease n=2 Tax=Thermomonospora umbrina TaxID=111806 RepID=A0A3D9SPH2_9ACTN|nr:drug/metabolite transporter (DMT)-like permease [Thermomonospora umbrina]